MPQPRRQDTHQNKREEDILIERLIRRQGESRERASLLVAQHRRGERAEIDPALMEGLEDL
jgi:hypothetical protein